MNLMRRLRGVVGSMSIWALVFAAIGVVGLIPVSLIYGLPPVASSRFLRVLVATIERWGLAGAGMGLAFATAVLLAERTRTRATLSVRRFTAWGFAAGAIVPMGLAILRELTGRSSPGFDLRAGVIFGGICGVAGAVLAAASVRAARREPVVLDDDQRVHTPVG